MGDEKYFAQALTNFTRNFAYGGAICHLVDKGYTTEKIIRDFQYPLPYDSIDKMVTDHLIDLVDMHFQKSLEDWAYVKKVDQDQIEMWLRKEEENTAAFSWISNIKTQVIRSFQGVRVLKVTGSLTDRKLAEQKHIPLEAGRYLKKE